jgi:rare lipoprotein A
MARIDSKEFRSYLRINITLAIVCIFVLFLHGCAGQPSYKPHSELNSYMETGMASYYATKFQHRKTANGERFDNNAMTAAHKTLPFGTEVIVTKFK